LIAIDLNYKLPLQCCTHFLFTKMQASGTQRLTPQSVTSMFSSWLYIILFTTGTISCSCW